MAVLPAAAVFVLAAAVALNRPAPSADMRITIEQMEGVQLRLSYASNRPQGSLTFAALPGGYRDRLWTIETPGFHLMRSEGEDRITRRDGKPFARVVLTAAADGNRLLKDYQPVARYGEGGALVYTGHFWPLTAQGERADAVFDILPARDGEVVVFGARVPALTDWRSPKSHPAFVYMGPLKPVETERLITLIDPATPRWIMDEFYALTPRAFAYFTETVGVLPETKPNLFLTAAPGGDEGRLSYAGDALPGQVQITLEGAGWNEPTAAAKDIFRRSTLHEAFHLWQSAGAQPEDETAASWIHEGVADATGVEAMLALGYWDSDAWASFKAGARRDCAAGLEGGELSSAHARREFKALYACGYLIADAVARADGTTATALWRDFMAAPGEVYAQAAFYQFVEERTGDRAFARDLRYFVETPLADPAREIDRLFGDAAPLAP